MDQHPEQLHHIGFLHLSALHRHRQGIQRSMHSRDAQPFFLLQHKGNTLRYL